MRSARQAVPKKAGSSWLRDSSGRLMFFSRAACTIVTHIWPFCRVASSAERRPPFDESRRERMSLLFTSRAATLAAHEPRRQECLRHWWGGHSWLPALASALLLFSAASLSAQTIPHVTGTFKTPENKTPSAA